MAHPPMSSTDRASSFWKKVNKTDSCWIFTGGKQKGYGKILVNGKPTRTHRYSYEIAKGPIQDGLFVCHHCDNRACVNPDHLFLGTQSQNMQDCIKKGRFSNPPRNYHIRGEVHWKSKLKSTDVLEIFSSCNYSKKRYGTKKMMAKKFNVNKSVITDICCGKAWSWLTGKTA